MVDRRRSKLSRAFSCVKQPVFKKWIKSTHSQLAHIIHRGARARLYSRIHIYTYVRRREQYDLMNGERNKYNEKRNSIYFMWERGERVCVHAFVSMSNFCLRDVRFHVMDWIRLENAHHVDDVEVNSLFDRIMKMVDSWWCRICVKCWQFIKFAFSSRDFFSSFPRRSQSSILSHSLILFRMSLSLGRVDSHSGSQWLRSVCSLLFSHARPLFRSPYV